MANDQAMVSKARSLFSQHLVLSDFVRMLETHEVPSIAAILKNETRYQTVLEDINDKSVHREFLEQRIRLQAHHEFNILMRYMKVDKHQFYQFYIQDLEIKHLIYALHAIETKSKSFLGQFMLDLDDFMVFDLNKLLAANTFEDVYNLVEHTHYKNALSSLLTDSPNLGVIEDRLRRAYKVNILSMIEFGKYQEVSDLFKMSLELENIELIFRLKKYYPGSYEALNGLKNGPYLHIPKEKIFKWIEKSSIEEMITDLQNSYYGRFVEFNLEQNIEYFVSNILFKVFSRKMRQSQKPNVVLFSYMHLLELEIQNIVDVVEGARYKLPSSEVIELLII